MPTDRLPAGEHVVQREPGLGDEHRLEFGDRRGEGRFVGQQLAAHARPLRTLTRVHEHRAGPARPFMREPPPHGAGRPPASARSPATASVVVTRAHRGEPWMAGPVVIERVRHIGQRHLRRRGPAIQSASTPAVASHPLRRSYPTPPTCDTAGESTSGADGTTCIRRLLHHHMRIRPADAERRHPRPARPPRTPGHCRPSTTRCSGRTPASVACGVNSVKFRCLGM